MYKFREVSLGGVPNKTGEGNVFRSEVHSKLSTERTINRELSTALPAAHKYFFITGSDCYWKIIEENIGLP